MDKVYIVWLYYGAVNKMRNVVKKEQLPLNDRKIHGMFQSQLAKDFWQMEMEYRKKIPEPQLPNGFYYEFNRTELGDILSRLLRDLRNGFSKRLDQTVRADYQLVISMASAVAKQHDMRLYVHDSSPEPIDYRCIAPENSAITDVEVDHDFDYDE